MRWLDFRSWSYWLDWSRLFSGEFLQADASLLEHLLDGALLLENSLYLVLKEDGKYCSSMWNMIKVSHIKNLKLKIFSRTLSWELSTASYWQQMALRSVRVCRDAVSKYRSSSCRAASAPSWDWQRSTGWLANRKMPSSHQCDAFEGGKYQWVLLRIQRICCGQLMKPSWHSYLLQSVVELHSS